jgi:hypothetical protein
MFHRTSRTSPAIGLNLAPQFDDPTRMTMTAVATVDTALAAKTTATEAHHAVGTSEHSHKSEFVAFFVASSGQQLI